jgi:hypothetical protein
MREFLMIGPTPHEEDCEQLGPRYDPERARAECVRFIDAIRQTVGPEPEGARLVATSNAHDFGTYYEVVVCFDADNEIAAGYASRVESDAPATWPETLGFVTAIL